VRHGVDGCHDRAHAPGGAIGGGALRCAVWRKIKLRRLRFFGLAHGPSSPILEAAWD